MPGWNFASLWDSIAQRVPERSALVSGGRRTSWGAFSERAARLAWHLQTELQLEPGDKVAIYLTNRPEYLETFFAALKLGCVPVNVDFRYTTNEVHHVLDESDAKVVVHGPGFTRVAKTATKRIPKPWRPALLEAGAPYERAVAGAPPPSEWVPRPPDGDDLVYLYTSGTRGATGMPEALVWRNDDLFAALWASAHPRSPEAPEPLAAVEAGMPPRTVLAAAPLMHGTGLSEALTALGAGDTVVLVDRQGLDADAVWDAVEREKVEELAIVGDGFARPLLAALEAAPGRWDLTGLDTIRSSVGSLSPETRRGLLEHLPEVTIAAGGATVPSADLKVTKWLRVIDEDTGLDVEPGSDAVGLVASGGHIPIGYYKDPVRTAARFRTIGGIRYSISGERATVDADGTVQLRRHASSPSDDPGATRAATQAIEAELRKHASVLDCVVVDVPDQELGEKTVALVQVTDNHYLDEAELVAWCRSHLTGYPAPQRFLFVDSLDRSASGTANHEALRQLAIDSLKE
ncbi:MAG: AMP-binding protein [Acidimicrobiia bacterium]